MLTTLRFLGKVNFIVLVAAIVTLGLFYTMQLLIMSDDRVVVRGAVRVIELLALPAIDHTPARETPKPEPLEEPPRIPDERLVRFNEKPSLNVARPQLGGSEEIDFQKPGLLGPADGDVMPIAQIQPVYPTRAQERGIEGYVIVEFDVSETGTVLNPRILVAEPPGMFDRAALRAVERWKYQPRVSDGKAVKRYGLQTRFSFDLRD